MKADPTIDIPTIKSNSENWVEWHKELVSNFGTKEANSLWMKAWGLRGNSSANTANLRSYMKGYGITMDDSAWDKVVDAGGGALDFLGSTFKVGRYMGIALGVIVIGGIGMIVFNLAKSPAQSIGTIAKAAI